MKPTVIRPWWKLAWRLFFTLTLMIAGSVMLAVVWRGSAVSEAPLPDPVRTTASASAPRPLWGFFHPAWHNQELHRLTPLVEDPMKRTDTQEAISQAMRSRVTFWMAIYGVFRSSHKVVHDRTRPDLIYGHIDLSPLEENLNPVQFANTSNRVETAIRKRLAGWLLELADGTTTEANGNWVEEKQQFRTFLISKGLETPDAWRSLANNLRTQSGQQDAFLKALARSQQLLPEIERVFAEHQLPRHAARIPFVESSFHPRAKSKIGAMGIWQFTPLTAREWIDRKDKARWSDPAAQTQAAARMLASFHKRLPDWGTTVTAYNSGPSRMARLVKQFGARRIEDILAQDGETNGLGFAGENFYAEVLAATLVEAYKTEIFTQNLLDGMLALKEVEDAPILGYCVPEGSGAESPAAIEAGGATTDPQGERVFRWLSRQWQRARSFLFLAE